MGAIYTQFFPKAPNLTESNLSSQNGKVFIVTGGASGVGYHLSSILYQAGAKVYIAGRSETNAQAAISAIKGAASGASTAGELEYLHLDLSDLSSIKSSAQAFQAKESKLDVLWNNAGVSSPPLGSVSKQGFELQIGTNCLGPLLFTQLLLPQLRAAAQSAPRGSVRLVWTSSQVVDLAAPKGGFPLSDLDNPPKDAMKNYVSSKLGNWFLAHEIARDVGAQGIISVVQNPGNLKTNLLRHYSGINLWLVRLFISPFLLYQAKFGAYTELWAGLSEELTIEENGGYVIPWGRMHPAPRKDLLDALKGKDDGGTGLATEFREWCEKQIAEYK